MRWTLFATLLIVFALPSSATEWKSTDGSDFTFEVLFEGEPLPGEFRDFDVDLTFNPTSLETAALRVTVELGAADMGDPDMNAVLFDPAWFDVEQYAEAVFTSDNIAEVSGGEFVATGELDLKGSRQSVTVPFSWQQTDDQATMQGAFVIRRTDFAVGEGEWATDDSIALDVNLAFTVSLVREK